MRRYWKRWPRTCRSSPEFRLETASPLSIPVLTDVRTEQVRGEGIEALLAETNMALEAEAKVEDVRAALA